MRHLALPLVVLILALGASALLLQDPGEVSPSMSMRVATDEDAVTDSGQTSPPASGTTTSRYSELDRMDRVSIRVIDTAGAAVPGARVAYVFEEDLPRPEELLQSGAGIDLDERVAAFGTKREADARGLIELEEFSGSGWATARAGNRYGATRLHPGTGGVIELAIAARPRTSIRVVDGSGASCADIPVAIQAMLPGGRPGPVVWRGITGPSGQASTEGLVERLRVMNMPAPELVAVPALPMAALPREPLSDGGVTTITLPPVGALEVTVDSPAKGPLSLRVYPADLLPKTKMSSELLPLSFVSVLPPEFTQVTTMSRRVTVPGLRVGRPVVLEIHDQSGVYQSRRFTVAGPRTEGEVTTLLARFDRRRPGVVGRAVSASGEAIAHGEIHVRRSSIPLLVESVTTDAGGGFRLPFRSAEARKGELAITTAGGRMQAIVSLDFAGDQDVQLGDVMMRVVPVAASGCVRDGDGAPVRGATVVLGGDLGSSVEARRVTTGDDGRFAFHAERTSDRVTLQTWSDGLVAENGQRTAVLDVAFGAEGLGLTLLRTGGLRGRVVLDEGVSPTELQIVEVRSGRMIRPMADGSFRMDGLMPGQASIAVHVATGGALAAPVTEVGPFSVRMDSLLEDDRLTIDLRARLHRFAFRLVDEDGAAVVGAEVRVEAATDARKRLVEPSASRGEVAFVATGARIGVTVLAEGFSPLDAMVDGATRELTLVAAPRVTFTLAADQRVAPNLRLSIEVTRDDDGTLGASTSAAPMTRSWRQTVSVPGAGRYRLEATMIRDEATDPETIDLGWIDVSSQPDQSHEIVLPL